MKRIMFLTLLLFLSSQILRAECFDYRGEMSKIENYVTSGIKSLKKVRKTTKLEQAQQLIDKAALQFEEAMSASVLAREFAQECSCGQGYSSAIVIHNALNDLLMLCQKAADTGSLEVTKGVLKANETFTEQLLNAITESTSYCIE